MNLRTEPGFLGTDAPFLADLTLLAYILLIVPGMLIGFYFARRKWFEPHHKTTMTGITLFNWVLILFVMAVSYSDSVAPQVPDNLNDRNYLLPTLHLITGGLAQILGTYLVIRMWFEKSLPSWFKVKNIKLFMRTTLVLWLVTALLGVSIYLTWYNSSSASSDNPAPVSTEEPGTDNVDAVITEEAEDIEGEVTPAATEDDEDSNEPVVTEEASDEDDEESEPVNTEEAG